jgi:hypothetical protein
MEKYAEIAEARLSAEIEIEPALIEDAAVHHDLFARRSR